MSEIELTQRESHKLSQEPFSTLITLIRVDLLVLADGFRHFCGITQKKCTSFSLTSSGSMLKLVWFFCMWPFRDPFHTVGPLPPKPYDHQ